MGNIRVIKRNGAIEDFKHTNIVKVVNAAGLDVNQSEGLAQRIKKKILEKGKTQITSMEIKDMVIEELKKINDNVANFYIWYQSTKDNNDQPTGQIS